MTNIVPGVTTGTSAANIINSDINEMIGARSSFATLGNRLDNLTISATLGGGNAATLVNGTISAGQKIVTVDGTTGFIGNARCVYLLTSGSIEYNIINTVDSPTQITLTTNIGTGGISDNTYLSLISESEYQASMIIPHSGSPTLVNAIDWANANIINVKAFGAKGDGVTIDTAAIQAAYSAATSIRGTVVFEKGTYLVDSGITVPFGVNTVGQGGKVVRVARLSGGTNLFKGAAFLLKGGNIVDGLIYDGGALTISVDGLDCMNYYDFGIAWYDDATIATGGGFRGVSITNCIMNNSCGAFIEGSGANIRVIGNFFGDHKDHAVYLAHHLIPENANDIESAIIVGNTVRAPTNTTSRGVFKIGGEFDGAVISSNVCYAPYSYFASIVTYGDDETPALVNKKIVIADNVITSCLEFISVQTVTTTTCEAIDKLQITGNIAHSTSYSMVFGGYAEGVRINNLVINGNTFNSPIIFNGELTYSGIGSILMQGNNLSLATPAGGSGIIYLAGNIGRMKVSENVFTSGTYLFQQIADDAVAPTAVGVIDVENNDCTGIYRLLYENSNSLTKSYVTHTYRFANNRMGADAYPVGVSGTHYAEATAVIRIIGWEASTTPASGNWQVGDIVYKSNPSANSIVGWACITAGIPGTWQAFGAEFLPLAGGTMTGGIVLGSNSSISGATVTLGDDAATSCTPTSTYGIIAINMHSALKNADGILAFKLIPTYNLMTILSTGASSVLAITTGSLSGTTGTDGKFTVSATTDGKIYFENRTNSSIAYGITLLGL